ncbi:ATP-binding protein [Coraliomargarita akajimensis]|uniref:ATP-binding region ATPase domain protein n=1 Tax=Coraliomargarita akajimensis (strain DSM 45221 / IAM 15411 / JCM 23193 / KCTC 12865 / 04OKA010-24) TaxID=583355 RepID=D5EQ13_CORAD|nr:ATP-binding protein [Coraliomargarita akajimensis]ADE55746.1 ATP-binding region ATPase domain protein [Coraliomargarita akajimensis DSM 45221]
MRFEKANPNPEYLIKSIAEQGYSLETALADLIDNSISAGANKIEILISTEDEPFTLYLADNGKGMSESRLRQSMEFPSESPETTRAGEDLGRFGLGMKTASFSQTRYFSVFSKEKGTQKYAGRTWDVERLKEKGWQMGVNSPEEVESSIKGYQKVSESFLKPFEGFEPNTIVQWRGLYKFENYIEDAARKEALQAQLNETTCEHLSLVFHRFMERKTDALEIRVNNKRLKPFNPFPVREKGIRKIAPKQKSFRSDHIKIDGIVLPSRCIDEVKHSQTIWTTKHRGLFDMEGIYVYRADRIILFGGWNGLIRKAPRLQLARMRVEVGNGVDHLLHLNVAKSQIVIPHDLRSGFESYIIDLKTEAEREFYNRGIRRFNEDKQTENRELFSRTPSNKGIRLELNHDFPLICALESALGESEKLQFKALIRMINTTVNKIKQTHEDTPCVKADSPNSFTNEEIKNLIRQLIEGGMSKSEIRRSILPLLGHTPESYPEDIAALFN